MDLSTYSAFFVISLLIVAPMTCKPIRDAKKGESSVNDDVGAWKQCPTYGTFAGNNDQDHNCCIRMGKCAFNATDIDSDLEQLVFRTKRAAGEDDTQMLVARQHNPQSRWEISLCETRATVIKPVFGVRAESNDQVQVLQIKPVFEQQAVLENCVIGPTLLVNGMCRQNFKTEEFFTLTVGVGGKVIVKREGLLVPSGCSVVVDMSPLRDRLELEFSRPLRPQYSLAPPESRIETVPVDSYTKLELEYDIDDEYLDQKESQINAEDDESGSPSADPSPNSQSQSQLSYDQLQGSSTEGGINVNRSTSDLGTTTYQPGTTEPHDQTQLSNNELDGTSANAATLVDESKLPNIDNSRVTTQAYVDNRLAEIEPDRVVIVSSTGETRISNVENDRFETNLQLGNPDPADENVLGFPERLTSVNYDTKPAEEPATVTYEPLSDQKSTQRHLENLSKLSDKVGLPLYFQDAEYDPVKNLTGN